MRRNKLFYRPAIILTFVMSLIAGQLPAQVATLQNWTNLYHGTITMQQDINYPVAEGSNSNRVLVVAIAADRSASGVVTVSLSYGGQPLLLADGDMGLSVRQHTAIYYLDEAGLDNAGSNLLSVSVSGGTIGFTDIWAALFDYVDQADPFTGIQKYTSMSTAVSGFSLAPPLSIDAYDKAIEVVSAYRNSYNQIPAITYAPDWTMVNEQTGMYSAGFSGWSVRNGVASRSYPVTDITDASPTSFSRDAFASVTAVSLNYEPPPPPTIQASDIIFSDVTSSSMTISWTNGDGTNRIVLIKEGSAVDSDPVYGTTYTASNIYGNGSEIGTGNYVIYNGTGNSVTVYNLDGYTVYHVAVYEFSGPPGLEYYLMDPARGSQLTEPESALTDDYRSNGSGNWATPEIWQTYSVTGWITATSAPAFESGVITIRNGHTITVAEDVTADQVVIQPEGTVIVSSGTTFTIADGSDDIDCIISGVLENSGTVTPTGVLSFNSGATYRHTANGGVVPAATWDAASLCLITGITAQAPSGLGQSFGNFTWNCVSQSSSPNPIMNSDVTVKGDFTLLSTGSGRLAVTNTSTSRTISISGNYYQTGGIFDLSSGSGNGSINVAGNFSFTGGAITESSTGRGSVVFNGNGAMQMYTAGGTLSNTIDFTVNPGANLQMGTATNPSVISGSNGRFTLSAGATIGITAQGGITLTATGQNGGNIQVTGLRYYDENAFFIYNGAGTQYAGNGLPPEVNSVVINNSGGDVRFVSARTINSLSIMTGSKAGLGNGLIHTTSLLALGGIGQLPGSYGHPDSEAEFTNDVFFFPSTGVINNAPPAGTWLGITDDWHTADNWTGGVPTSETSASISSYTAYQPVITGPVTAVCGDLTINPGASLTVEASGSATIGTITNNGTLNLNSDENGIASLIVDDYSGNGTENIQIYLTGGGDEATYPWHYISSPVTTLSTDVFTTGDNPTYDLAAYYEQLGEGSQHEGWVAWDGWDYSLGNYPENPEDYYTFSNLDPGKGYNIYFYEPYVVKTFAGTPNTSDETESLSYSGTEDNDDLKGWNLLGNPFSSSLNWDDIALNLPGGGEIDNAIYFTWNNQRVSYIDGVGSVEGVTGNIPPMQGFFVKSNTAGQSLTLPASARIHSTQNRYKGPGGLIPLLRLKIEGSKNSYDETVVRFDTKARHEFDSRLDAHKFSKTGDNISLWTTIGSVSYSINSIPFPETSTEVAVGISISETGNYILKATTLQGLENYNVYLIDRSTGFTADLKRNPVLNFTASKGTLNERFIIKTENISAGIENPEVAVNKFNIYQTNGMINIETLSDEWDGKRGSVEILSMTGSVVSKRVNEEFHKSSLIQIPSPGSGGIYFIKIESGLLRYVGRVVVK